MAVQIMWNDKYLVGVTEIDDQHKALFKLYNTLLDVFETDDHAVISHAFEEMASYLDQHFSSEEKYWRLDEKIYREHRKLHFDFVKYVLKQTRGDARLDSLGDLLEFLSTWLLDHVQTVDKVQFQQLREQGLL